MKSELKFIRTFILLLLLSSVFGCAAGGPAFQRISSIPEEKGLIYIYRSKSFVGSAVRYNVHAGDKVIGILHNGGYFTYLADPGELEIWAKTEAKGSVTLDVLSGKEHYVKGSLGVGIVVGRPKLIIVGTETGTREIKKCKLTQTE